MTSMESLPPGYRGLVIGASGGIGESLVETLRHDTRAGDVVGLSRSVDGLELEKEWTLHAHATSLTDKSFNMIVCATGALTIDTRGPEKPLSKSIATP